MRISTRVAIIGAIFISILIGASIFLEIPLIDGAKTVQTDVGVELIIDGNDVSVSWTSTGPYYVQFLTGESRGSAIIADSAGFTIDGLPHIETFSIAGVSPDLSVAIKIVDRATTPDHEFIYWIRG